MTIVNSFQKALLNVKADADRGRSPIKFDESDDIIENRRPALRTIQAQGHHAGTVVESTGITLQPPSSVPSLELPVVAKEHNDLSVIAEDEEPFERAQPSTSAREAELFDSFPQPPPMLVENATSFHQESKLVSVSDMDADIFRSVPLDSPSEHDLSRNNDPHVQITGSSMVVDSDTGQIPRRRIPSDRGEHPTDNALEDNASTIVLKSVDKLQSSLFPTLPEPMPLRKSIRLRDPSMTTTMLSAATPGAAGGKRTSWLAKAREVKALEGNSRKMNAHVIPMQPALNSMTTANVGLTQGTKRKSEEMLAENNLVYQEGERVLKIPKLIEGTSAPRISEQKLFSSPVLNNQETSEPSKETRTETHDSNIFEEGVLDILKKTVQGLGVRGKTMGKSLGGDAATALAEAKAAAEARLAERDRREETTHAVGQVPPIDPTIPRHSPENRVSISDLFPRDGRVKEKHKAPEKVFHKATPQPTVTPKDTEAIRLSTSTTPPNSPPPTAKFFGPVFTKLAPVFVPPIQVASKLIPTPVEVFEPALPLHNVPSMIGTKLPSPSGKSLPTPLTAQSTMESVDSEKVFDRDDSPAWMPSTQDTEYTGEFGSQSQPQAQICDEDDSWPVDDKLAAGVQWTYGVSKEDSMTWSTLPSHSQRADSGPLTTRSVIEEEDAERGHDVTEECDVEMDNEGDLIPRDEELEEIVLGSQSTVNLVKVGVLPTILIITLNLIAQQPDLTTSRSQSSMAASESSQSHTGFFGHASKFLSSALGTSKKKPEVKKVLQMAAVAAKKVSRVISSLC